jgi:hypothetical protein
MRSLSILFGTTVLIAVAHSNFAQAETQNRTFDTISQTEMADILRGLGYSAEVAEEEKQQYLKTTISDYEVNVYFNGCKQDRCTGLRLSAGFDKAPNYTVEFANKWNYEHDYAYANVDPSDGAFYFDQDFLVKGVTEEFIKANLSLFVELLDELEDAAK